MRLLICAGGTGGGVYPALAVLQAIEDKMMPVLWIGGQGGMEAGLVQRAGVPFRGIPAAGVHGVGLRALPGNGWKLLQGAFAARRIIREFKPGALFFTGGYVAPPVATIAGRTPSLVYVPDIEPGLALKYVANSARVIAVTTEDARRYFPARKRIVVTGYPTRPDLLRLDKAAARARLGLRSDLPVLLVTGGSRGARSINQALLAILDNLPEALQIVHITGELDWPAIQDAVQKLPAHRAGNYHAYPYLHEEMGTVLAAADIVVSRAGASTLGEYPLFGLPAILVPYPYAWRYQKTNAEYLVRRKAAIMILDAEMTERLHPTLKGLLEQPQKLEAMRQSMLSIARPQAAAEIAGLLYEIAGEAKPKGSMGL